MDIIWTLYGHYIDEPLVNQHFETLEEISRYSATRAGTGNAGSGNRREKCL